MSRRRKYAALNALRESSSNCSKMRASARFALTTLTAVNASWMARRETTVGDPVDQRTTAYSRRRLDDHPADRERDKHHHQGKPGIEGRHDREATRESVNGDQGPDDRALDEIYDHRAVLVDAEDGVPDTAVVVVLERQRLGAFDHRNPEILVDALPDPHAVVAERRAEKTAEHATHDGPHQQAIADRTALILRQLGFDRRGRRLFFTPHSSRRLANAFLAARAFALGTPDLAELLRVRRHVLVADEQHRRLDRLQPFAEQHLVVQEVHPDEETDEARSAAREDECKDHHDVNEHRPHVRPRAKRELEHPAETQLGAVPRRAACRCSPRRGKVDDGCRPGCSPHGHARSFGCRVRSARPPPVTRSTDRPMHSLRHWSSFGRANVAIVTHAPSKGKAGNAPSFALANNGS